MFQKHLQSLFNCASGKEAKKINKRMFAYENTLRPETKESFLRFLIEGNYLKVPLPIPVCDDGLFVSNE